MAEKSPLFLSDLCQIYHSVSRKQNFFIISFLFLPLLTDPRVGTSVRTVWSWDDRSSRSSGSDWIVPLSPAVQTMRTDVCVWTSPTALESILLYMTWTFQESRSLNGRGKKDAGPEAEIDGGDTQQRFDFDCNSDCELFILHHPQQHLSHTDINLWEPAGLTCSILHLQSPPPIFQHELCFLSTLSSAALASTCRQHTAAAPSSTFILCQQNPEPPPPGLSLPQSRNNRKTSTLGLCHKPAASSTCRY